MCEHKLGSLTGTLGTLLPVVLLLTGCPDEKAADDSNTTGTPTTCSGTLSADCGGDPSGTWTISSICADQSLVQAYNENMGTQHADCSDLYRIASLSVGTGSITYSDGSYTGNLTFNEHTVISMSADCYYALYGFSLDANACSTYATFLKPSFDTVSCTYINSTCNCTLDTATAFGQGTYTVSGSTLVKDGVTSIDYCVFGNTMVQRMPILGTTHAIIRLSRN